jgi:hypothetical protein
MRFSWQLKLGIVLLLISAAIYSAKLLIVKNPVETLNYIFNSLGFLPISAFLVTVILNELLGIRARRQRLEKLNMVIETFYSEVGTEILTYFSDCDPGLATIRKRMVITNASTENDVRELSIFLDKYSFDVDLKRIDLEKLRDFLNERRNFLLRLLENPVLLEHQSFTETLRAVFHLTEELTRRKDTVALPDTDILHLKGDMVRAYRVIALQWVDYMGYLKNNYPYLFSLAMRVNPFDENASVIVKG